MIKITTIISGSRPLQEPDKKKYKEVLKRALKKEFLENNKEGIIEFMNDLRHKIGYKSSDPVNVTMDWDTAVYIQDNFNISAKKDTSLFMACIFLAYSLKQKNI